jgi:hypothetical protein
MTGSTVPNFTPINGATSQGTNPSGGKNGSLPDAIQSATNRSECRLARNLCAVSQSRMTPYILGS